MGMCQTCYFLDYKKKRALKQKQKLEEEAFAEKAKIDSAQPVPKRRSEAIICNSSYGSYESYKLVVLQMNLSCVFVVLHFGNDANFS